MYVRYFIYAVTTVVVLAGLLLLSTAFNTYSQFGYIPTDPLVLGLALIVFGVFCLIRSFYYREFQERNRSNLQK